MFTDIPIPAWLSALMIICYLFYFIAPNTGKPNVTPPKPPPPMPPPKSTRFRAVDGCVYDDLKKMVSFDFKARNIPNANVKAIEMAERLNRMDDQILVTR